MISLPTIYDKDRLIYRIKNTLENEDKKIAYLVGSPLTYPMADGKPGVPGVTGIIDLIKDEFSSSVDLRKKLEVELNQATDNKYQVAFRFLIGYKGQNVSNSVIRKAVVKARKVGRDQQEILDEACGITNNTVSTCSKLDDDVDGWELSSGVENLGRILAEYGDDIGDVVLTPNFDPLIEVAIKKAGGKYLRTVMSLDGGIGQTTGHGCNVVHFHGYWNGSDTLHIPDQLLSQRPKIRASLRELLGNRLVVVIAYGGWDDIFTSALSDVIDDSNMFPDVLWCFREEDEAALARKNEQLIKKLQGGIGRSRVNLYKGIDVNKFFPDLISNLNESPKLKIKRVENIKKKVS